MLLGYGKNSGNWNFKVAAEAARVEAKMLAQNLCMTEMARSCRCSTATFKEFLKNGTHNKAYKALIKKGWL